MLQPQHNAARKSVAPLISEQSTITAKAKGAITSKGQITAAYAVIFEPRYLFILAAPPFYADCITKKRPCIAYLRKAAIFYEAVGIYPFCLF